MPLHLVLPPEGTRTLAIPKSLSGELHIVEAWPGSVVYEREPTLGMCTVSGFALAASGGLPEAYFGHVVIVPLDRVEQMRASQEAIMMLRREPSP